MLATVALVPAFAADVLVNMTPNPTTVVAGGTSTFTLRVDNNAADAAANVVLSNPIPAGTQFVSITAPSGVTCSFPAPASCDLGTLAGGAFVTIDLVLRLNTQGTTTNTATVTTTSTDTNAINNTISKTVTVLTGANLSATQTASPEPVIAGQNLTYTIASSNAGPNSATGVQLVNTLPPNVTFVSATGTGWSCSTAGQVVTCTRSGTVAVGSLPSLTIVGTPTVNGTSTNSLTISANEGDADPSNNTTTLNSTVLAGADMRLTWTVSPSTVGQGSNSTFTATVFNDGPLGATGATFTYTVPASLNFVSVSNANCSYNAGTRVVSCAFPGTLAANSSIAPFTVVVTGQGVGVVANVASVSSALQDPNTTNNSVSRNLTVTAAGSDVSSEKVVTASLVPIGTNFEYRLRIRNLGPSPLPATAAITITDTLPVGVDFVSSNGAGVWTVNYDGPTRTVTCTATQALAVNATTTQCRITVVATTANPTLTNTQCATVTGAGVEADNNPANNCDSVTSNVTADTANVSVTVTQSVNSVAGGTPHTINLNVANVGPDTARSVVVTLPMNPATLIAATPSVGTCSTSGSAPNITLTCSLGDVAVGATPTIAVNYRPLNGAGTRTNTATVSTQTGDPVTSNNTSSLAVTITPSADLQVTKTATPNPVQQGTSLTYVVTVRNAGVDPATSVVMTDTLPANIRLLSVTPSAGSCSGVPALNTVLSSSNSFTCSFGTLNANAQQTATIVVEPAAGPTITNTASATSAVTDPDTSNNSASVTTTITAPSIDVSITKVDSPDPVPLNANFLYILQVRNNGPSRATNIVLTENIPAEFAFVSIVTGQGSCNPTLRPIVCNLGDLALNGTINLTLTMTATTAGSFTNTASVTATEPESNTANNTSSETTTSRIPADLQITKTGTPTPLNTGQNITFTLTVRHNGPSPNPQTAVTVTDTLPAGMTFVSSTPSQGTCSGTSTVTCALGTLALNAQATVTIVATANTAGAKTNTATVTGGEVESDLTNNTSSFPFVVIGPPDLTVTKTHTGTFARGGTGNFTVTVRNSGGTDTSGLVTMSDTLPATLTPTAAAGTGWTCNIAAQTVTCTRNDALAPGQNYPAITIGVTIGAAAPNNLSNTAEVAGGSEVNLANNSSTDPVTIIDGTDLTINKTRTGALTPGATNVSYTLTVSNVGASSTSGTVDVLDTIPTGLTPTSASGTGWACGIGGQAVGCTRSDSLAAAASYPDITIVVTVANNATGTITNTGTVSGGGDTNPANNSSSNSGTVTSVPDLTINKTRTGTLTPGATGLTYDLTVNNVGAAATAGTVTVTDPLPASLTPTAAAGTGWTCGIAAQTVTCTRADALAAAASYPAISITFSVGAGATGTITNTATVGGGGEVNTTNNTASESGTVATNPDLTIAKTRTGALSQGATGVIYNLTVSNVTAVATAGTVTVTDPIPAGLTPTAASGTGWTCNIAAQTVTCTRTDSLAGAASYPAIAITVDVSPTATGTITNTGTVSGGGDTNAANNSASESGTVTLQPDLTILKTRTGVLNQGATGVVYNLTVSNVGGAASAGTVTVTDPIPASLTPTAASGTGWTCGIAGQNVTCTRNDALAAAAAYPPIAITVSVAVTATGTITNTGTVAGGGDVNPANNTSSESGTVGLQPDLTILKTRTGALNQGATGVTYTLAVSNIGGSASTGTVTVTDPIPTGLTPTAASGTGWTCGIAGQTVTCTRNDALAASAAYPPITIAVNVALTATGTITNTGTVSGGGDVNPANNSSTESGPIGLQPDLTILKTRTGVLNQGATGVTYTLAVSNVGAAASTGTVTVTDPIPTGLTPTAASGTGWTCGIAGQTVTCTRNDALAASAAYPPITITVNVALTATGIITNTGTVSGGGDVNPVNNSSTESGPIGLQPDLTILKTRTGALTQGATGVTYTLAVSNVGGAASTGTVTVTDPIPSILTPVSAAGTGWSCSLTGQNVTCTRSDALAASAAYPPITVTVNVPLASTGTAVNTGTVAGGGDVNPANNTSTETGSLVLAPDLSILKTRNGLMPLGGSGSYTLTIQNVGQAASAGLVTVSDPLPAGLTYVSSTSPGWTASVAGQNLTFTRSDALAVSASYPPITIVVAVSQTAPSPLVNTATVSGGGDTNPANNTSTDSTSAAPPPDLTIVKAREGQLRAGQPITYRLTVRNVGANPTSAPVSVSDPFPAELTPVSAEGAGWICTVSTPLVVCNRSDVLAAGASYPTITVIANVAATATGSVSNTATVSGGNEINTSNNTSTDTGPLELPDLSILKTNGGNFRQSGTGVFTITVSNAGSVTSNGLVRITDTIPDKLTPSSAAGSGWNCTIAGQLVQCERTTTLTPAQSFPPVTITVQIAADAPSGIINWAEVASTPPDTNPENNASSTSVLIAGVPDMTVTKTVSGAIQQGGAGDFVLTARNSGTAPTSGPVSLNDPFPNGLTPESAAGDGWICTVTGQTVNCQRFDIIGTGAAYPPVTVRARAAIGAAASLTNVVTVSGGGEINTSNNTASVPVSILATPDLTIVKTATASFSQGQPAAYSLVVSNVGLAAASGTATVADTLPTPLAPVSASGAGWTCGIAGQTVTCTRADGLAAGAAWPPITLNVTVAGNAPSPITNVATVALPGEGNTSNNSSSVTTPVAGGPDLSIIKTHAGIFTQGQIGATYTISVINVGALPSTGQVTVTDSVPAGLTLTAAGGAGWTCSVNAPTATCTRSDVLPPGASYPDLQLTVNVSQTAPTNIVNVGTVSGGGDVNPTNNSDDDPATVSPAPDPTITIRFGAPVVQGQLTNVVIDVPNVGDASTTGPLTVTVNFPVGLTPQPASPAGWACTVSGQTAVCVTTQVLAVGATLPPITIPALTASNAPSSLTVETTVAGGADRNLTNNAANVPATVAGVPDLTILKTAPGAFVAGQNGAYSLAVSNVGGVATSGTVTVTDPLPSGLTPLSAAGAGWNCAIAAQTVTCTRADVLAAGAAYPAVAVTASITLAAGATVVNTATVSGGGDVSPPNNTSSTSTPINGGQIPDLTVTITQSDSLLAGPTGAYTVTARNVGTAATSGTASVVVDIPFGLTPGAASGQGWTCNTSGQTVTCTRADSLASGASYPPFQIPVTITPQAPPSVTAVATVSGGGEVNLANNRDQISAAIAGVTDLSISKSLSGTFLTGTIGSFQSRVTNVGAAPSSGLVTVVDTIPAGLEPLSASGSGWSCSIAGQIVTCTRPDSLAPGGTWPEISVAVRVTANDPVTLVSPVEVSGGGDTNPANNRAQVEVALPGAPDLTITNTLLDPPVRGASARFRLETRNLGPATSLGPVTVTNTYPAGITPTAVSGAGWVCAIFRQTVSCTRSEPLATGAAYPVIDVTTTIQANAPASLDTLAVVSGGGDINPSNNSDPEPLALLSGPDLTIFKTREGAFTVPSGGSYRLEIRNVGGVASAGPVTVSDPLPAGLTYVNAFGDGWNCAQDAGAVTCTRGDSLAVGASWPPIVIAVGVTSSTPTTLVNTATVSGGGDALTGNNSSTNTAQLPGILDYTVGIFSNGNLLAGGSGRYTVTSRNVGTGANTGQILIYTNIPEGVTATGASGPGWICSIQGQLVTCLRNDIFPGGAVLPDIDIPIQVSPNAPNTLTATAEVVTTGDAVAANNRASTTNNLTGTPDLRLSKVRDGALIRGGNGSYTLQVTNGGTASSFGPVVITDPAPAGLTPVSASGDGWACSVVGSQVICTRSDSLPPSGAFPPVRVNVGVAPDAPANVTNRATVSGGGDTTPGNNTASASGAVGAAPDLSLTKTSSGVFTLGGTGSYQFAVSNVGAVATQGVVTVVDNVPAGLAPVAVSGSGWTCSIAGQTVTCTRPDSLPPGGAYPPVNLTVNVTATEPAEFNNTATVSGGGDPNPRNNQGQVAVPVRPAPPAPAPPAESNLSLNKAVAGELVQGGRAAYQLTVRNNGGTTEGVVTITDSLPSYLRPTAAAGPGWNCTVAGQLVTCSRSDTLAPGAAWPEITLDVDVDRNAPPLAVNVAELRGGNPADPAPRRAQVESPVAGAPDMRLRKTSTGPLLRGETGEFRLDVSNAGAGPSRGTVTVRDTLPPELTPSEAVGEGWTCAIEGQVFICTREDSIPPGGSYPPLFVRTLVAPDAPDTITNTASVSGGGELEPDLNNTGAASNPVQAPAPDLSVNKTVSGDLRQGGTAEFRIAVRNLGQGASSGSVIALDSLPAGVTAISAAGNGWRCAIAGQSVTCERNDALRPGAAYDDIVIVTRIAPNAPASLVNTASISVTGDRNPGNNTTQLPFQVLPLPAPELLISKVADRPLVEVGDIITYRIEIVNPSQLSGAEDVLISDGLPTGLHYVPGTAAIATGLGAPQPVEPVNIGNRLSFPIGRIPGLGRVELTYRVRVGADARGSDLVNVALVTGRGVSGAPMPGRQGRATVRLGRGLFTMRQFLIGRVFEDANHNGMFDKGERPVAGARLYLSNGQSATTDSEGLYNFPTVGEGSFVVTLDPVSLPDQYGLMDEGQRWGDSWTRLVRTPLGGGAMLRQNFPLRAMRRDTEQRAEAFYTARRQVEYRPQEKDKALPHESAEPAAVREGGPPPVAAEVSAKRSSGAVQRLEMAFDRTQLEAGGRQSLGITVRAFDENGKPVNGDVALETTAGQFLVSREDACVIGDQTARCIGPAVAGAGIGPGMGTGMSAGPMTMGVQIGASSGSGVSGAGGALSSGSGSGMSSAPPILRPLETGRTHPNVGLIGAGTEAAGGQTAEQFDELKRQHVIRLVNGVGTVRLIAGNEPGAAKLKASADGLEAEGGIEFVPEDRPPLLVGFGEVSIGRAAPEFRLFGQEGDVHRRGEIFFRDTVAKKNTFTFAYSSVRPINRSAGNDRLFQTDPFTDRLYPVFGDSSTRYEYAQSNAKFYGKWERGRSHVMFGDMRSDFAQTQRSGLTDFQRSLTGVRVHLEDQAGAKLVLRGARPDTAFARDVFPGYTFGLVRLSRPNILQGSETITLETRDRRNPDLVLRRETLVRNVDYNLDWAVGSIFFLRQINALDASLNLTQIVVTYEYQATGTSTWVYSARGEKQFQDLGLRLGFSFLNQRESSIGAYYLAGLEIDQKLGESGTLKIEAPLSRGPAEAAGSFFQDGGPSERNGQAIRVELEKPVEIESNAVSKAVLRGVFSKTQANFLNPFGSSIVPGAQRGGGSVDLNTRKIGIVKFGFLDERNRTANVDNARTTGSFGWAFNFAERFELSAGYDYRSFRDERGRQDIQSNLVSAGVEARVTGKLQAGVRREQNLTDADPTYPNQTLLMARYDLGVASRLFFTQRLASAPIVPIGDLSQSGFAAIQSRRETSLGVESRLNRNVSFGTRYMLENGLNGPDNFAVIGLVNRIPVNQQFSADLTLERGFHMAGNGKSFLAAGLGLGWQPKENWRASGRYELRDRNGFGNIFTLGSAGRLAEGVTTLAAIQYSRADFGGQRGESMFGTLALALRPLKTDRHGLLFGYSLRSSDGATFRTGLGQSERIGILSSDAYWQVLKPLEVFGRFAWSDRAFGATGQQRLGSNTFLTQGRAQLRVARYFDLAGEVRRIFQPVTGTAQQSAGAEIGFWVLRDLRAGIGYNFHSLDALNRNFGLGTGRRGVYFTLTTKLSNLFDLWGTPSTRLGREVKPEEKKPEPQRRP